MMIWRAIRRFFSPMRRWLVTLRMGKGVVTVVPCIGKSAFEEGKVVVLQDVDDDAVEIMMLVKAADTDHAAERAMPGIHAARMEYLKSVAEAWGPRSGSVLKKSTGGFEMLR